jgi:hypothetical protein
VRQRTIFSVRPFQRSSPIALYCLLEVAIGGSRRPRLLVDTVHFPFMVGYTVPQITPVTRTFLRQNQKLKNVAPGTTSPSRDCAPPFLSPLSYPLDSRNKQRHSIMAIRRLKNTRTSMRHASSTSYQFLSKLKKMLNLQHTYPADPSGHDVPRPRAA